MITKCPSTSSLSTPSSASSLSSNSAYDLNDLRYCDQIQPTCDNLYKNEKLFNQQINTIMDDKHLSMLRRRRSGTWP